MRLCADRGSCRRLLSSVVGLWYEQPARALFSPGTCPWVDAPWLADGAAVGCGYWVRLGHGRLARSSAVAGFWVGVDFAFGHGGHGILLFWLGGFVPR